MKLTRELIVAVKAVVTDRNAAAIDCSKRAEKEALRQTLKNPIVRKLRVDGTALLCKLSKIESLLRRFHFSSDGVPLYSFADQFKPQRWNENRILASLAGATQPEAAKILKEIGIRL